jgi:hypothetical protein
MYMNGYVDIDPSHATEIRRKPTKGFRRFAEILTGGALSQQEEHETFTALSILQEINVALRSLGITDVVRFTKDDVIIYDDQDSESTDDMEIVLEKLQRESGMGKASVFQSLSLLLEHHLPEITLIIEVRISRTHFVGGYPIRIAVNGLSTQFQTQSDDLSLKDRLDQAFANQGSYEAFESELRTEFDNFMMRLEETVRQKMAIDDARRSTQLNIVRPRNEDNPATASSLANQSTNDHSSSNSDPVFQRYHSGSDAFAYCWMWSSLMHSHGTHVQNATIVDEQGQRLMTVGEEGFNAGESSALDPSTPFEDSDAILFDPTAGDVGDDATSRMSGFSGGDDGATGSSWLDSFGFGGDSDGGDFGSGCSSCGGD